MSILIGEKEIHFKVEMLGCMHRHNKKIYLFMRKAVGDVDPCLYGSGVGPWSLILVSEP